MSVVHLDVSGSSTALCASGTQASGPQRSRERQHFGCCSCVILKLLVDRLFQPEEGTDVVPTDEGFQQDGIPLLLHMKLVKDF